MFHFEPYSYPTPSRLWNKPFTVRVLSFLLLYPLYSVPFWPLDSTTLIPYTVTRLVVRCPSTLLRVVQTPVPTTESCPLARYLFKRSPSLFRISSGVLLVPLSPLNEWNKRCYRVEDNQFQVECPLFERTWRPKIVSYGTTFGLGLLHCKVGSTLVFLLSY